jgi:superoxide dismutase, Fe-Mn family
MHTYTPYTFTIPPLTGISEKQISVHLALYAGYVKNYNTLNSQIDELQKLDAEKYAFTIETLRRRAGWEFNGMRNHEFYFEQFEQSKTAYDAAQKLTEELEKSFGSRDAFIAEFKKICMSRGPGWALLSQDRKDKNLILSWTTEHEQGTLADTQILLAADMWEHAFMVDYTPAEKMKHFDAFLVNVSWGVVESRLLA